MSEEPDNVLYMVAISSSLNIHVQNRSADVMAKANYRAGVTNATEGLLALMFSDESVKRAVVAFEALPELPTDERITHAIAAALGAHIVTGEDGVSSVVPTDPVADPSPKN